MKTFNYYEIRIRVTNRRADLLALADVDAHHRHKRDSGLVRTIDSADSADDIATMLTSVRMHPGGRKALFELPAGSTTPARSKVIGGSADAMAYMRVNGYAE